uniref:Uncharacterized protein n=1 Tax=Acrobeloides nanus TaxID=290746 RepID=A0A914DGX6_9BILA
MIFENISDDFLLHDDDDVRGGYGCFIQVYVELFLAIQNPNKMFKNIVFKEDIFDIPREFLNQNNIVSQKYRIEEDEDGYKMLFETDDFGTDITKELFEIKRDDGYILRILSDTEPIYNDNSKLLMFTIHHKDCPPEEFVPNWPAFPMARDQLGFDYVDMYGNLLEC